MSRITALLTAGLAWLLPQAGHTAIVFDGIAGGSVILGYIEGTDDTIAGTQRALPVPLTAAADGNLSTNTSTYSGEEPGANVNAFGAPNNGAPLDFVGALWSTPVSEVTAIRLYSRLYADGGWFGTAAGDTHAPNSNNNLADAADLAAPSVQVSTDGGANWTTIPAASDYEAVIGPAVAANFNGVVTTPALFEFAPQSGITGLRLVGFGGGRSDVPAGQDEQGFIGVAEFEVGFVPVPPALILLAAPLGWLGMSARRPRACASAR